MVIDKMRGPCYITVCERTEHVLEELDIGAIKVYVDYYYYSSMCRTRALYRIIKLSFVN